MNLNRSHFFLVFLFIFHLGFIYVSAQETNSNLDKRSEALAGSLAYTSACKESLPLLNGKLNNYQYPRANGHPYLLDPWDSTSAFVNQFRCSTIDLQYDIFNDYLIYSINSDEGRIPVILSTSRIDSFKLNNRKFIYVDTINGYSFHGYIEVFVKDNNNMLVAKHSKTFEGPTQTEKGKYLEKTKYYLITDQAVFSVKGKNTYSQAYPACKKQISIFIKSNRLLFTSDKIVSSYTKLIKNQSLICKP